MMPLVASARVAFLWFLVVLGRVGREAHGEAVPSDQRGSGIAGARSERVVAQ